MASDASRAELYSLLRRDLPVDTAGALMDALPPLDWNEVARRSDIASVRAELKTDFAELKTDFADLKGDFADLKVQFAELAGRIDGQVPKLMLVNVASAFATASLVLAAVQL